MKRAYLLVACFPFGAIFLPQVLFIAIKMTSVTRSHQGDITPSSLSGWTKGRIEEVFLLLIKGRM